MTQFELHQGDCLEVMKTLPDNSVDSIVTDPPYGISFMGKKWDYDVPGVDVWAEALRLLKPGGHILVACGTRTQHRMVVNIEDAGFEIRDTVAWIYGSGFPKSLDVSKAIDKMHGAERETVGQNTNGSGAQPHKLNNHGTGDTGIGYMDGSGKVFDITAPASDDAKQWSGWGTALKPAMELWTLARKPLIGTVAQNVIEHGTGGINIDGCRVGYASPHDKQTAHVNALGPVERFKTTKPIYEGGKQNGGFADTHSSLGRFPANVIHDGSDEVLAHFPNTTSGKVTSDKDAYGDGSMFLNGVSNQNNQHGDAGSAARFFYCAKASKSDRNGGLDGFPVDRPDSRTAIGMGTFEEKGVQPQQNHHPTVKPTALMQYLCRLITPPGGTVLDPYTGSGSTGKAAMFEDFRFIGIERELEYVEIATARIEAARTREPLFLEADSQKTQGRLF